MFHISLTLVSQNWVYDTSLEEALHKLGFEHENSKTFVQTHESKKKHFRPKSVQGTTFYVFVFLHARQCQGHKRL